jgi:hypothetical protein
MLDADARGECLNLPRSFGNELPNLIFEASRGISLTETEAPDFPPCAEGRDGKRQREARPDKTKRGGHVNPQGAAFGRGYQKRADAILAPRPVLSTLRLQAALKRGGLIAAANWPVVLVDFTLESFYKLTLTVPILGGALMVAAILGTDLQEVVGEGVRATADLVLSSLATAPVALTSFLAALALVGLGGEAIMFAIKIGTLSVLVTGERVAGDIHATPVRAETLRRAAVYSLDAVYGGVRRFGRRALLLALWLGATYALIGVAYLAVLGYGFSIALRLTWIPAWPLLVAVATTTGVVVIAAINLAYDLLRVIIVTDDCSVRLAAGRLRRFVIEDSRQVIGIFAVIGGVLILTTAASIFAAAGLALVAWVPILGLAVVPLQAAAWILRGLLLQYMALSALSAYQTQYRRFSEMRWEEDGVSAEDGVRPRTTGV